MTSFMNSVDRPMMLSFSLFNKLELLILSTKKSAPTASTDTRLGPSLILKLAVAAKVKHVILIFKSIHRRFSRKVTARGSSTSHKAGGPTKV